MMIDPSGTTVFLSTPSISPSIIPITGIPRRASISAAIVVVSSPIVITSPAPFTSSNVDSAAWSIIAILLRHETISTILGFDFVRLMPPVFTLAVKRSILRFSSFSIPCDFLLSLEPGYLSIPAFNFNIGVCDFTYHYTIKPNVFTCEPSSNAGG